MRLQKYFSDCGILSRRAAEAEITAGKVLLNGCPARIGDSVTPGVDVVEYRGKRVLPRTEDKPYRYLMLHKPRGYVTTAQDEHGRHTVTELVTGVGTRVYPVGRLDMDSEGLLLLTDDGAFANLLTHPRHHIPKIYHVTLSAPPTEEQLRRLRAPMQLDGYRLQPIKIRHINANILEMQLYEGRNRQIRRMCDAVGLHVARLCRVAIGQLRLQSLPVGQWRFLTPEEVRYLKTAEENSDSQNRTSGLPTVHQNQEGS